MKNKVPKSKRSKRLIAIFIAMLLLIIIVLLWQFGRDGLYSLFIPVGGTINTSEPPPPTVTPRPLPTDTPTPTGTSTPASTPTGTPIPSPTGPFTTEEVSDTASPEPATSAPTAEARTNTPPPTIVAGDGAEVVFDVRNISGDLIGQGTLSIFAPASVLYPESAIITLELFLTAKYVTPTPFGLEVTRVPIVTATPGEGTPTSTPRSPIHETMGVDVYQLMGASLFCPPEGFTGCDNERDPTNAELITLDGETWSWIVSPAENISGLQDFEIQVWLLRTVSGQTRTDVVWDHRFRIDANPSEVRGEAFPLSNGVLYGLAGTLLLVIGMGLFTYRQRQRRARITIFISYRRQDSQGTTGRIYDRLVEHFGKSAVFRDVDTIKPGEDFEKKIREALSQHEVLLAIIGRDWLTITNDAGQPRIQQADDMVRLEIKIALNLGLMVIPVLVDGATMPAPDALPADIQALSKRNAISIRNESFDDDVQRLIRQWRE